MCVCVCVCVCVSKALCQLHFPDEGRQGVWCCVRSRSVVWASSQFSPFSGTLLTGERRRHVRASLSLSLSLFFSLYLVGKEDLSSYVQYDSVVPCVSFMVSSSAWTSF